MTATKVRRVPCPEPGCTYTAENAGSIPAHVAMAHPGGSARNDACVRDKAGCGTHDAIWIPGDPQCHARGGRLSPYEEPEDQLACIGSNHVPGCDHFKASAAIPPAADAPTTAPTAGAMLVDLPLDLVDIGDNVRVDVTELEELAASIAEHGVLQPIKATGPHPDGRYLVVWGQRRTLASRMAGATTIPAFVLAADDAVDAHGPARSIEQLVENLHRADLNPIDRARAMRAVVDGGTSQADLARSLGIAPSTVSNDLRLLTLDDQVVERIREGSITASHGKAIASLPAKQQAQLAHSIAVRGLSSHGLEQELKWRQDEAANDKAKAERTTKWIPKAIAALEAAAVPKDVVVRLSNANTYTVDSDPIVAAIAAAGWTTVSTGYGNDRPAAGRCDCTAVRLDVGGRKAEVKPICTDHRHLDRAVNVDRAAQDEVRKAYEARLAVVRDELVHELRAAVEANYLALPILRIIEKAVATYSYTPAPDADLVAAIADAVMATWRVREAITPELVAELGLEVPA